MPAYNFKKAFAPDVESGKKRQTIRPKRKRRTKPGDTLYLFTGMRSKGCVRLRVETCLSVKPITIGFNRTRVDGKYISIRAECKLAKADGFANAREYHAFFTAHYDMPTKNMELITW